MSERNLLIDFLGISISISPKEFRTNCGTIRCPRHTEDENFIALGTQINSLSIVSTPAPTIIHFCTAGKDRLKPVITITGHHSGTCTLPDK